VVSEGRGDPQFPSPTLEPQYLLSSSCSVREMLTTQAERFSKEEVMGSHGAPTTQLVAQPPEKQPPLTELCLIPSSTTLDGETEAQEVKSLA
jgi:hypothetical protein